MKIRRAILLLFALFVAANSFSQCSICSTPAAPSEYGGTVTSYQYRGTTLQLWATIPTVAICERDWYKVVGTDTTSLGTGDTLSVVADTTCKYIARNKNTCTGGSTYYSTYTVMSNVTVVDSPTASIPTYTVGFSPVMCSGTTTNIFLSTTTRTTFEYLRNNTTNVSGSTTGALYNGPLSITLTNNTSTAQIVRILIWAGTGSPLTFANYEALYITVLPSTAPSGNHCFAPPVPHDWQNQYGAWAVTYYKGAQTQLIADTTIAADSVLWYKVVGTDTTYTGNGYSINVTTDTSCLYIARNANICNCSTASTYYSSFFPMSQFTVITGYTPPPFWVNNYMPTIASGTQVDLITAPDTGAFIINTLYMDNANVTGRSFGGGGAGYIFSNTLTNTTTVPQVVRYWFQSATTASGYPSGNTVMGYITVLPSTSTAPTGNHCKVPAAVNQRQYYSTENYVKGATVNLDVNHVSSARYEYNIPNADSVYWYKVRWAGDTSYLGNSYPINAVMDTNCIIYTNTTDVCYWSDSSKHIYYSGLSPSIKATTYPGNDPKVTLSNNVPTICNGRWTNIQVSAPSGSVVSWQRDNTPKVTGTLTNNMYYTFPAILADSLLDTISVPQTVHFVAGTWATISGVNCQGSTALAAVTVLSSSAPAGNHCFAPAPPATFVNWNTLNSHTFLKGSYIQILADSTVIADSIQWYKVVGLDTTYIGQGYSIGVTTDTSCQFFARTVNVCNCSSGSLYYSTLTLMTYITVTSGTPPNFSITNYMPTIASGTGIDLVPSIGSESFNDFAVYLDNAKVTSTIYTYSSGVKTVSGSYLNGFNFTLTNTTSVPQLVRYWFLSANSSTVNGNTVSGYITVLPSTSTAPTGNHCTLPPLANQYSPGGWTASSGQSVCFIKGVTANWDLGNVFSCSTITADSLEWFKTRWPGDTTYLGNSYPINAVIDTNCTIFTVSKNVCYWLDSSKHIYTSAQSQIGQITAAVATNPTVTLTNNAPYLCSGQPTNIQVSASSGSTVNWVRDESWLPAGTPKVTGTSSGSFSSYPSRLRGQKI